MRSQYPHSRAASCRAIPVTPVFEVTRLNTLTVGQPLVGTGLLAFPELELCLNTLTVGQPLVGFDFETNDYSYTGLNTLTVGQPLVGDRTVRAPYVDGRVSIPSQSGSLLSAASRSA